MTADVIPTDTDTPIDLIDPMSRISPASALSYVGSPIVDISVRVRPSFAELEFSAFHLLALRYKEPGTSLGPEE